jgi:signal transduction histidine kinase
MMAASLARFVEIGRIELERSDVEIGDLVLDAVNHVLPLCVLRRQLLVTDISDEGLVVHVDAPRITQALERLLTNVAKLSGSTATLAVTTRKQVGRAVVTITSQTLPRASIAELGLGYVEQLCELHEGMLMSTPGQLRVMLPLRE